MTESSGSPSVPTTQGERTPIREKSLNGQPPRRESIVRGCDECGADFLAAAPGKTGLRGIWTECGRWLCSIECRDRQEATP